MTENQPERIDFHVYRAYDREGNLVKLVLSDMADCFAEYRPQPDGTYEKQLYRLPRGTVPPRTRSVCLTDLDELTRALLEHPCLGDIPLLHPLPEGLYRCYGLLFSITEQRSSPAYVSDLHEMTPGSSSAD